MQERVRTLHRAWRINGVMRYNGVLTHCSARESKILRAPFAKAGHGPHGGLHEWDLRLLSSLKAPKVGSNRSRRIQQEMVPMHPNARFLPLVPLPTDDKMKENEVTSQRLMYLQVTYL